MRTALDAAEYLTARADEFAKDAAHAAALGQDEDASWLLTATVWFRDAAQRIRDDALDTLTDPARHDVAVWR